MKDMINLAPYAGVLVKAVPAGTIISDSFGVEPDVVVDDETAAVVRGTMFVTDVVWDRIRNAVPEAKK